MIVAVPPEPVAPFGDIDFFPGFGKRRQKTEVRSQKRVNCFAIPTSGFRLLGSFHQMLACPVQRIPCGIVLLVADPDGEVVSDPTARGEAWQRIPRRVFLQKVATSERADA